MSHASSIPRRTDAILTISALLLGLVLVGLWSRLPGTPTAAVAEMVAAAGPDVALMTSDGGSDDIVVVLDQRAEELLVYQPQNQKSLAFRGRFGLRELFAEGRVLGGTPPAPTRPTPTPITNPTR